MLKEKEGIKKKKKNPVTLQGQSLVSWNTEDVRTVSSYNTYLQLIWFLHSSQNELHNWATTYFPSY